MGYLYRVGKSKVWYMGYKDGRGRWKRKSTGTRHKGAARATLEERELKVARGEDPDGPAQPFEAFAKEYIQYKKARGLKAVSRDDGSLRLHLTPFFRGRRLDSIRREDLDRYVCYRLAQEATPGTVQRELGALKGLLTLALKWDRIKHHPGVKFSVPGATVRRRRFLTPAEVEKLLAEASPRCRDIIEAALLTGCRKGEILALKERDCDFLRDEVILRDTKAGESQTVPMHPRVREILWSRCRGVEERPVFDAGSFRTAFAGALRRAGLSDIRFHDLRRTCASWLLMKGADPKSVQAILRHRDMRMTMDIYAQVSRAHVHEAIRKLPRPGAKRVISASTNIAHSRPGLTTPEA